MAVAMVIGLVASASAADFVRIGANPMSANTAFPSVHVLKAFNGRLYCGYGEWNNHPAMMIGSYRPDTGRWHVEHSAFTDAIGSFKEINGRLYVPHIDPVHYEDFKDFSVLENGVWRDAAPLGLFHVFDMATLTGTDLWCVGSKSLYETNGGAVVYRSLDNGRTWQDMTLPTAETRYYYCYVLSGKLRVNDAVYDENGVGQLVASSGSPLRAKTRTIRSGTNELALSLNTPQGPGVALTGPVQILGTSQAGFDYAWDGTWVYVLKADGIYRRAFPFITGEVFERMAIDGMPANPRSMEVMEGIVYVADALGVLWGARLDGGSMTPPVALPVNELPDEFGRALSVDGNSMAVGAPGNFTRFSFLGGQVTLWELLPSVNGQSNWIKKTTIDPPAAMLNGWFGREVLLKGDLLAITEAGRDLTLKDRGYSAQVHLYQRITNTWVRRQSLNHSFVHSVAIEGENMVVSEIYVQEPFPGTRFTDLRVNYYRLERTNELVSARFLARLHNNNSALYEPVQRVAMESNVVVVSTSGDVSRFGGAGRVLVRELLPTGEWVLTNTLEHTELIASGTNALKPDRFGFSLALKNGWLAVGAPRDDESAQDAGAVYLYQRIALTNGNLSFVEMQKLLPPDPQPEGRFGEALAMPGSRLFVGSPGVEEPGEWNRGRVYVYERVKTNWVLIGQMQRPVGSAAEFGIEVAANENWMVAGSRFSNASSNLTDRVAVQPHLSPYAMWAAYHGLEGASAVPSADSDGDGADNGAEYAYRLNPQHADALPLDPQGGTSGLPSVRWVREEAGAFIEITRLQHRHPVLMGLSYATEVSADLISWTPAEILSSGVASINNEWERVTLRFAGRTSEAQLFYRIKVGIQMEGGLP